MRLTGLIFSLLASPFIYFPIYSYSLKILHHFFLLHCFVEPGTTDGHVDFFCIGEFLMNFFQSVCIAYRFACLSSSNSSSFLHHLQPIIIHILPTSSISSYLPFLQYFVLLSQYSYSDYRLKTYLTVYCGKAFSIRGSHSLLYNNIYRKKLQH